MDDDVTAFLILAVVGYFVYAALKATATGGAVATALGDAASAGAAVADAVSQTVSSTANALTYKAPSSLPLADQTQLMQLQDPFTTLFSFGLGIPPVTNADGSVSLQA